MSGIISHEAKRDCCGNFVHFLGESISRRGDDYFYDQKMQMNCHTFASTC